MHTTLQLPAVPKIAAAENPKKPPGQLMSIAHVTETLGVSRFTIWMWSRDGKFPKPMKFSGRNYWRSAQINNWLEDNFSDNYPRPAVPAAKNRK